jgi:L-ribulokinase
LAEKEKPRYAIGLDFGTKSVRTLIVDVRNGDEVGTAILNYPTGDAGIILDPRNPNLARQNPSDWLQGIEASVPEAVAQAKKKIRAFSPSHIIGIGVAPGSVRNANSLAHS